MAGHCPCPIIDMVTHCFCNLKTLGINTHTLKQTILIVPLGFWCKCWKNIVIKVLSYCLALFSHVRRGIFCEGMMTCITSDSPDMGNADCWVTNLQLKFTGSEMQVAGSSLRQTSCGSYIWKEAKKQKGCVTKSVWKQVLTCLCGNLIPFTWFLLQIDLMHICPFSPRRTQVSDPQSWMGQCTLGLWWPCWTGVTALWRCPSWKMWPQWLSVMPSLHKRFMRR